MTGRDLKQRRLELGYSQAKLGKAFGLSASTISRFERLDYKEVPHSYLFDKAFELLKTMLRLKGH